MKNFVLYFMLLFAPMLMAQTPAHKVTLHWQPSTTSTVTHYGVYRSPVSGGPYTYLGYTTGLSYVNTKNPDGTPLPEGQTYFYVVVAFTDPDPVTKKSAHSPNSNEATATIPVTPQVAAATGLGADAQ